MNSEMKKDYKELIKLVEERKKELNKQLNKTIFFKKRIYNVINKYDALLLKLYSKYESED